MLGRFFYFESNGSSANQGNHLVEVQIVDTEGVNRALSRGVLRYSAITGSFSSTKNVTDGNTSYSSYFDFGEGRQHVVIDLGAVYDISYIKVWRYYADGRYYKDVYIKVSLDDVNYTTVFSSAVDGTYNETADGKQIDILNLEHDAYDEPEEFFVEYLQSTGQQYFNTYIVPTANTEVEIKYSIQGISLYGAHVLSAPGWYCPFPRDNNSEKIFLTNRLGAEAIINLPYELNVDYTVKVFPSDKVIINDVEYTTVSSGSITVTAPLYMFTYGGYGGDAGNTNYTGSVKIYYCKIWQDGELIRDFVPMVRNGIAGMYDRINDVFYSSQGPVGFLADGVVEEPPALILNMPLKDSLTYTGEQCTINVGGSDTITFTEDAFSATAYNDITIDFPRILSAFTIFLRFKMYSNGASQYPLYRRLIWGFNSSNSKVFSLEVGYSSGATTNKLYFGQSFTNELNDDNWHTCVLRRSGQTITCTIDDIYTDTISTTVQFQRIVLSHQSYVFNGLIKDVKVYDRIVDDPGNVEEPEVPSEYTRLKYIESSGAQFIRTGVTAKSTLRVRLKFLLTSAENAGILGYMQSASTGSDRFALFQTGGAWYLDFGSDTNRISGGSFSANTLYHVEFGNGYLKDLNTGQNIISGEAFTAFQKDVELSICGEVLCGIGKWYEVQIYDDERLIRDFVPAKDSNGTVGMYDNVGGVFYTNAGTGAFVGELASGPVEGTGVSLVKGVSYGINGGKCMIGGTAYLVSKGMIMVDGTAYLIGEAAKPIPVTITGTGDLSKCYVKINGTTYMAGVDGVAQEVMAGDTIYFYVMSSKSSYTSRIVIDGTTVASNPSNKTYASYNWTVPESCKSIAIKLTKLGNSNNSRYWNITVTTT